MGRAPTYSHGTCAIAAPWIARTPDLTTVALGHSQDHQYQADCLISIDERSHCSTCVETKPNAPHAINLGKIASPSTSSLSTVQIRVQHAYLDLVSSAVLEKVVIKFHPYVYRCITRLWVSPEFRLIIVTLFPPFLCARIISQGNKGYIGPVHNKNCEQRLRTRITGDRARYLLLPCLLIIVPFIIQVCQENLPPQQSGLIRNNRFSPCAK